MKHFSFLAAALMAATLLASCTKNNDADEIFVAPTLNWDLDESSVSDFMEQAGFELTESEQEDPAADYYYAPVQTVLGDCAWTYHFYAGQFYSVEGEISMDGKDMQTIKDYFDTHYDLLDVMQVFSEDGYYALYYGPDSVLTELELGSVNAYVTFSKSLEWNPETEYEDDEY